MARHETSVLRLQYVDGSPITWGIRSSPTLDVYRGYKNRIDLYTCYLHSIGCFPLRLLLIGITFYIFILFLRANEVGSEGIILKNRYRKTFANKITNSRLNIRHISRRLPESTDRTLYIHVHIYGNDFCEHTQNASIPSVECFVITVITYYMRYVYLHVSVLYSKIPDSNFIIIMK